MVHPFGSMESECGGLRHSDHRCDTRVEWQRCDGRRSGRILCHGSNSPERARCQGRRRSHPRSRLCATAVKEPSTRSRSLCRLAGPSASQKSATTQQITILVLEQFLRQPIELNAGLEPGAAVQPCKVRRMQRMTASSPKLPNGKLFSLQVFVTLAQNNRWAIWNLMK